MRGIILVKDPPSFRTFELAHRFEGGQHKFEVAYGSSFNELYYDFSPKEFLGSANRPELELQLGRAGQGWLVSVLLGIASGGVSYTAEEIAAMASVHKNAG